MRRVVGVNVTESGVAVDVLAHASGLSKQKIKDAMTKGACWWMKGRKKVRLRRAKQPVAPGQELELCYDEGILAKAPVEASLVYDGPRYSVWFKPHGLHTQGTQWGDHCSLLRQVEKHRNRPAFLVHRLDADAAGLVLMAHDGKAAGVLSERFSSRNIEKVYHAEVNGVLDARNLEITDAVDGKTARSVVNSLGRLEDGKVTKVEVSIETGRKHQIRKHLAGLGHPIVGDRLYGGDAGAASGSELKLVAVRLAFDCPMEKRRQVFEWVAC